jgi:hypothetical protein
VYRAARLPARGKSRRPRTDACPLTHRARPRSSTKKVHRTGRREPEPVRTLDWESSGRRDARRLAPHRIPEPSGDLCHRGDGQPGFVFGILIQGGATPGCDTASIRRLRQRVSRPSLAPLVIGGRTTELLRVRRASDSQPQLRMRDSSCSQPIAAVAREFIADRRLVTLVGAACAVSPTSMLGTLRVHSSQSRVRMTLQPTCLDA